MMPELDQYAGTVLSAYLVSLALLAMIVLVSWSRSVRVRRQLGQLEARRRGRPEDHG